MGYVPRVVWALGILGFVTVGIGCRSAEEPVVASPASESAFEFALIGDNPYEPVNVPDFEALINEINGETDLEWVIHVGDILGPRTMTCSDERLRARFDLFQPFQAPFIFTPGDNDWFDCVRETAGGFDDYERLDFLRDLFFADPGVTTGGRPMEVNSQSTHPGFEEFVENAMWTKGDVWCSLPCI